MPHLSIHPVHVLSTRSFADAWLDQLRALSPRLVIDQVTADTADQVPDSVWAEVEVLYTWGALPDPAQAPNLRWVQLDTAGVNHLLDTPLWKSDVALTTLNGVAPSNMAEFALMMMMAFGHRLPLMLELQRRREWPSFQFRWENFTPHELRGATLGVIGYGTIGRELGRLAHAFGIRVLGMNRSGHSSARPLTFAIPALQGLPGGEPDELFTPARLGEMAAACDYVVVIAPYTEATHHLVDEAALRAMKSSAVLINIARGGVVDEAALTRSAGRLDCRCCPRRLRAGAAAGRQSPVGHAQRHHFAPRRRLYRALLRGNSGVIRRKLASLSGR